MKNQVRFSEVSQKLDSMFKGQTESKKDEIVKGLKGWCMANPNTDDKGKYDAIKSFLADNNIY